MSSNVSDTITVTINGKEQDVFMSFGLLNYLSSIVSDPSQVPAIPVTPVLRDGVLKALFAKRKKSGKVEEEVDYDDLDVSIEDAERALDFAMEHLTNFFIRALKKVVAMSERNREEMASLESSLDGLKA